jgi:hypothetical protein
MRPLATTAACLVLAALATAAEARGRDAKHFRLPQYDEAAMDGLLVAPNYDTRSLERMIDARTAAGGDVVDWRFSEGSFDNGDGVDHWVMGWVEPNRTLPPGFAATLVSQLQDGRFSISYTHEWPALLSGEAGAYGFDVSPHAGIGLSDAGHSAEAGATLRFGDLDGRSRLRRALGLVAVDGARFGQRGRWYVFVAISGRAVGVNMRRDALDGEWRPAVLSTDQTSGFITSAQAGVAWRQGPVQASLGYMRRRVRIAAPHPELYSSGDNAVALALAVKPEL